MSRNNSHLHQKSTHTHEVINNNNLNAINTNAATSNTHLQNLVNYGGAGNNRTIGDATTRLQVYPYAADYAGNMRALKCDSSGRLECSVDALEVTAETINLNTDTLEAKLESLVNYGGAGNNDLGDGSSRLQAFMYGHDGSSTQRRVKVDGDGHLQVDVLSMSGGGDATAANQVLHNTKLDTLETTLTNIETDQAALEVLHTATNSKLDTIDAVLDTIKLDSAAIKTAVELLDNTVSGSELQVDVVSAPTTTVTGTVTANLSATDNAVLDSILAKNTEIDSVLDTIKTDSAAIKTAVELLDNTVSGSELQVDVVSMPTTTVTGTVTANLSATDNAVLDSILAKNTEIDSVLDTIKTDSAAIKTAVELLDNTVSGSELQVDVVSMPTTTVTGTVTANLSATDNAVLDAILVDTSAIKTDAAALEVLQTSTNSKLDTLETTLTAIETDQAALEVLHTATNSALTTIDSVLDTIKVDTEAIETAVEALNTRDSLTTTLIIDGQSVSSGGGTHTSSSFEITNIPRGGKLMFLLRVATVSGGDIAPEFLASADDTNFFTIPQTFTQVENTTTGVGRVATLSYIPKHLKVQLTNTNFSSAATCTVHMFN